MATQNRTNLEKVEQVIIVSTLLLLVVITVQPILNLLAISLSEPDKVLTMSGMAVVPEGFSTDVWKILFDCRCFNVKDFSHFFQNLHYNHKSEYI